VDAPIALLFAMVPCWRRATARRRSASSFLHCSVYLRCELGSLLRRKSARDNRPATRNLHLDFGRGQKLTVNYDGQTLADALPRNVREQLLARIRKDDLNRRAA
jgi:hypothetical protein